MTARMFPWTLVMILIGAGLGWFGASGAAGAMLTGALGGVLLFWLARLARKIWPIAALLVVVAYTPVWFLARLVSRLVSGLTEYGFDAIQPIVVETMTYQFSYWPNRIPLWDALMTPPYWFAITAGIAFLLAGLRAQLIHPRESAG